MVQRPLTLILLQKYRDTNGGRIVIQKAVYVLLSAKRRAYICKSIVKEMGGVSRYFAVDLTLLKAARVSFQEFGWSPRAR